MQNDVMSTIVPTFLRDCTYRCELHTHNPEWVPVDFLAELENKGILQIVAFKLNKSTSQLFPSPQTFCISSSIDIDKVINHLITDMKVPGLWVTDPGPFDCNDYYNITVKHADGQLIEIDYHKVDR